MKINQSDKINLNYAAKIVRLDNGRKHQNADRLKVFTIDYQNVITDLSYNDGDVVVYFPVECSINKDFISYIDGFIEPEMNQDKTKVGFFGKYSRVKSISLRGEKSQGFIIKVSILEDFLKERVEYELDKDFDRVGDIVLCQKYVNPNVRVAREAKNQPKKERISRIIDNQFKYHIDTNNLRKNIHKIQPNDLIGISYKTHGCVSGSSVLNTLEFGDKTIKDIVKNKIKCHVKAYDTEINDIVYAKIDQYYLKRNDGDWFQIELEDGTKLEITGNNPIWLPDLKCYRRVDELEIDLNVLID